MLEVDMIDPHGTLQILLSSYMKSALSLI